MSVVLRQIGVMMDKRTVASAHSRIDDLNVTSASLRTEVTIQHKELFTRVKRLEAIMIGASGAIILMLLAVLTKMG